MSLYEKRRATPAFAERTCPDSADVVGLSGPQGGALFMRCQRSSLGDREVERDPGLRRIAELGNTPSLTEGIRVDRTRTQLPVPCRHSHAAISG